MKPYKPREWVSRNEWRKIKRAKEKTRREYQKQKEVKDAAQRTIFEEEAARRREIAKGLNTRLWSWGVNSEKHPTYRMGVFPTLVVIFIGIPIMAILYKLSFTWVGFVMIVVVYLGAKL